MQHSNKDKRGDGSKKATKEKILWLLPNYILADFNDEHPCAIYPEYY
jgi:hypothetical protein